MIIEYAFSFAPLFLSLSFLLFPFLLIYIFLSSVILSIFFYNIECKRLFKHGNWGADKLKDRTLQPLSFQAQAFNKACAEVEGISDPGGIVWRLFCAVKTRERLTGIRLITFLGFSDNKGIFGGTRSSY